jgi:thiol-disulfide isomerase/thioredoxin
MNRFAKLLTITAFAFVLSGCSLLGIKQDLTEELPPATSDSPSETLDPQDAVDEPAEDGLTSADADVQTKDLPETSVAAVTKSTPQYMDFTEAKYKELLDSGQAFALFFHADWCPTCRQMEKNFNETLSSFPNGTIILKANYDNEKELKKTYDIRTQSTITVVGASGEKLVTLATPENEVLKAAIMESFES